MSTNEQAFNFNHLSLADLVEARDLFHAHLINKKNVVATALGRYLIRVTDIDNSCRIIASKPGQQKEARTLGNSIVIDTSWPCILVFVDQWQTNKELIASVSTDIIPKTIYMPDGRLVPVCVVEAPKNEAAADPVVLEDLRFPTNMIGGGFPMIIRSQMQDNVATVGCLVSDGHTFYALTNRHVSGNPGQVIETILGNTRIPIGVSSGNSISKINFTKLYPGWKGEHVSVNCDTGLIAVDDINIWKTSILGIAEIDEIYDLNTYNLSLGLISEHKLENHIIMDAGNGNVVGYGAIGGLLKGEISALFYRYKSIGGIEYVSDFLIGGRNGKPLTTNHGDSGMLWLLENMKTKNEGKEIIKYKVFQPIALHWGKHSFYTANQEGNYSYSLSTSISNICRELDVEIIRGWNIDLDYSWGKVGHYTIGNKAIGAISDVTLQAFMNKNLENISLKDQFISAGLDQKGGNPKLITDPDKGFCPLADVPDIIWKQYKKSKDGTKGTDWGRKGDENPNHFADADAPTLNKGGNLFVRCDSVEKMTVDVWQEYYKDIDFDASGIIKPVSLGLICFRVWQIFNYMLASKSPEEFIFSAGVLAHYVGDGCQPLHSSYMADGNPRENKFIMYTPTRGGSKHPKGKPYKKPTNPGAGVHVAYEDKMVDDNIGDILKKLDAMMDDNKSAVNKEMIIEIKTGQDAAFAVLKLMQATQSDIPPVNLVNAFKTAKAAKKNMSEELYSEFGEKTVLIIARGCRYLAAIWDAAWAKGKLGTKFKKADLVKKDPDALIALYRDPKNLPSMQLGTIDGILK
jgi:hypothetical protein